MEIAKLAIAMAALGLLLAPGATALVPYNPRSILELMLSPPDDPFKILEQSPVAAGEGAAVALARADWRETADEHQISVDVPGMKKEDVKIEVEENRVLRVSGERRAEEEVKDERWHRVERTAGRFWRQFRMPPDADMDKVSARLEDGVLRITVPKMKGQAARKDPKLIDIVSHSHHQDDDLRKKEL